MPLTPLILAAIVASIIAIGIIRFCHRLRLLLWAFGYENRRENR